MAHLYALLVGIDAYRAPIRGLRGCRNDIARAAAFLHANAAAGTTVWTRELWDGAATRAAVIEAFRDHLGRAGPADTALFWFSGHGSTAAVPPELWHLEPAGQLQTMLCVDSRHGANDLANQELDLLIHEVAARGAQVAVVLDCSHSGGAARSPGDDRAGWSGLPAGVRVRWVPPLLSPPPADGFLPELRRRDAAGRPATAGGAPDRVALAACHSFQGAHEVALGGEPRGLFSLALLTVLGQFGPGATYRELFTAARSYLENLLDTQVPALYPVAGELADQPFLGGQIGRPTTAITMRYLRGGWEIDLGACHGLVAGAVPAPGPGTADAGTARDAPHGATLVAVPGSEPPLAARVLRVFTERSTVEPLGWQPDPNRHYSVSVTSVPLPATTVAFGARPRVNGTTLATRTTAASASPAAPGWPAGVGVATPGDSAIPGHQPVPGHGAAAGSVAAVATAVSVAAGGRPSPHLRVVDPTDPHQVPELRVVEDRTGTVQILGLSGARLSPGRVVTGPDTAARVVADLEHIARWRQVKQLANPRSRLANRVRVDLVCPRPGDLTVPLDEPPQPPGADGKVHLSYRRGPGGWTPPTAFVRIHNRTDQRLYCVLLDLTDQFRMHADLLPGTFIGPHHAVAAAEGEPIEFSLPPGRMVRPGASAQDWLVLLASEAEFSSQPFALPRLGEPLPGALWCDPAEAARPGVLERLGFIAMCRDAIPPTAVTAHDWTTLVLPVVTTIPASAPAPEPASG